MATNILVPNSHTDDEVISRLEEAGYVAKKTTVRGQKAIETNAPENQARKLFWDWTLEVNPELR